MSEEHERERADMWFHKWSETDIALKAANRKLARVETLHKPFAIYDECRHEHKPDDEAVVYVDDIGYTCLKAYDICRACCTTDGEQLEACMEHDHGPGKPSCATFLVLSLSQESGGVTR